MGIRQEHDKVLKLQVVQTLYGMIPHRERAQHEASFESACRTVLGETWDESGLSMESADGLSHYLRGVHSASGTPLRANTKKTMIGLAIGVASLESRLSAYGDDSLEQAMALPAMERDAQLLFKRYGLAGLSTEGKVWEGVKLVGSILGHLLNPFSKSSIVNAPKEEPFDPKKIDYEQVHKVADYIDNATSLVEHIGQKSVEGKISGEGIVKNLTWGHEFDEKNPLTFLKKKFADWEKFYHAHEAAVDRLSKAIESDEVSTRNACKAAKDDEEKMDDILDKAIKALSKIENPATVGARMKPVFPGARMLEFTKAKYMFEYGAIDTIPDKAAKDIKEIRPLTSEEAQALLHWLRDTVRDLKKYTTVFDKARWSDHSDGDEFWDITEQCSNVDTYGGMIYWQSCDNDFMYGIDDISTILSYLANGILTWVDRSFPNA